MAEETEPTFRVDVSSRPILVLINGRANFLNCSPLRTFFRKMLQKGKTDFVLEFSNCLGMDSTFLGILAGLAIETTRDKTKGSLTLAGLNDRNLELVKNLGLQRIVTIVAKPVEDVIEGGTGTEGLDVEKQSEQQKKEMLISAHEDLVKIDRSNLEKFEDLLTFLKNEE